MYKIKIENEKIVNTKTEQKYNTIGEDWDVENALKAELEAVRKCMPTRILFLDATETTLREHKENDLTRSRNFFEHHMQRLLPLKREWFYSKENVDILTI